MGRTLSHTTLICSQHGPLPSHSCTDKDFLETGRLSQKARTRKVMLRGCVLSLHFLLIWLSLTVKCWHLRLVQEWSSSASLSVFQIMFLLISYLG